MQNPVPVSRYQVSLIALEVVAALVTAFTIPWPQSEIFTAILLIIAVVSLICLIDETQKAAARAATQEAREIARERAHAESLERMQSQLNDILAITIRAHGPSTAPKMPLALRDKASEMSSKVMDFVLSRQVALPKPTEVYAKVLADDKVSVGDKWQPEYWKSVHKHLADTWQLYSEEVKPEVVELYRRISQAGFTDPELEKALNAEVTQWPDDVFTVGERLRELGGT